MSWGLCRLMILNFRSQRLRRHRRLSVRSTRSCSDEASDRMAAYQRAMCRRRLCLTATHSAYVEAQAQCAAGHQYARAPRSNRLQGSCLRQAPAHDLLDRHPMPSQGIARRCFEPAQTLLRPDAAGSPASLIGQRGLRHAVPMPVWLDHRRLRQLQLGVLAESVSPRRAARARATGRCV